MLSALIEIIPLGIVAAVTPIGTITAIQLNRTSQPVANTIAYVLGGACVYLVLAIVGALVLGGARIFRQHGHPSQLTFWLDIAAGTLFVAAGTFAIVKRKPRSLPSRVQQALATLSPVKAFVLGVVILSPGARNLALLFVALGAVASQGLGVAASTVSLGLFVLLALGPAMAPVVVALTKPPDVAQAIIGSWTSWLERNGQVLIGAIVLALGVKLLVEGLVGLAT
jgi:hypothetical protein